jgi:hypothetical protein
VARSAFTVTFVAQPGVDGIKSFRALLKVALRRFGLRAIDAREIHDDPQAKAPRDEFEANTARGSVSLAAKPRRTPC